MPDILLIGTNWHKITIVSLCLGWRESWERTLMAQGDAPKVMRPYWDFKVKTNVTFTNKKKDSSGVGGGWKSVLTGLSQIVQVFVLPVSAGGRPNSPHPVGSTRSQREGTFFTKKTGGECFRKVHELILILLNHTHNNYNTTGDPCMYQHICAPSVQSCEMSNFLHRQ